MVIFMFFGHAITYQSSEYMTKRLGGYKKFLRNFSLDIQAQNFRKRLGIGVPISESRKPVFPKFSIPTQPT